jgi:hypothetical protein
MFSITDRVFVFGKKKKAGPKKKFMLVFQSFSLRSPSRLVKLQPR